MSRIPGVPFVQGRNSYRDVDGDKFGIAIHDTSNDATDTGEADYATHRGDGISAHLYTDADSVTQSLDTKARAGHAGSRHGNENAVAVEITGTNSKSRAWWLAHVAWDRLGRALGWLIVNDPDFRDFKIRRATVAEMKANPKTRAFYSHDQMRRAWGGTSHTDPGDNFPWDRLISATNAGIAAAGGRPSTPAPTPPARPPAANWTEQLVRKLPTLNRGDHGPAVKRAQALANAAGQKLTEDGEFGGVTEAAIKAEQRQASITADGVVGPQTWAALLGVR